MLYWKFPKKNEQWINWNIYNTSGFTIMIIYDEPIDRIILIFFCTMDYRFHKCLNEQWFRVLFYDDTRLQSRLHVGTNGSIISVHRLPEIWPSDSTSYQYTQVPEVRCGGLQFPKSSGQGQFRQGKYILPYIGESLTYKCVPWHVCILNKIYSSFISFYYEVQLKSLTKINNNKAKLLCTLVPLNINALIRFYINSFYSRFILNFVL